MEKIIVIYKVSDPDWFAIKRILRKAPRLAPWLQAKDARTSPPLVAMSEIQGREPESKLWHKPEHKPAPVVPVDWNTMQRRT